MSQDNVAAALRECEEARERLAELLQSQGEWSEMAIEADKEVDAAIARYGEACREAERGEQIMTVERARATLEQIKAAARLAGIEEAIRAYHAYGIDGIERAADRLRREAGK